MNGTEILATRRARVESLAALASPAWREWVHEATRECPVESRFASEAAYDRGQHPEVRERLGQVFTPPALAAALAELVGAERPGTVLDPACGDGSLLLAVAGRRYAAGQDTAAILGSMYGWDIDPVAAWLCRLALVEWALHHQRGPAPGPLAISDKDLFTPGMAVDLVVCNPPYLEAKRMRRASPGLKERLKAQFPQLTGAFDLYLAVAYRTLELAPCVGLIVPNKVCQGRYARLFRASIDEQGRLAGLLDCSRLRPRPFPGSSVYPVVLHLEERESTRMARVTTPAQLARPRYDEVRPLHVGGESPWFVPFRTWPVLEDLFDGPRLETIATVVSTCSFHKKGLREQFVTEERPPDGLPYLGGPSRARQTEVAPFQQRWQGWWIRFEADRLREMGNALPPLENFRRPKVVFNQHDRRLSAWADLDGEFVTKDVYPIAWPSSPAWSVEALTALFNSTVFTALYNTVYQGIVVGGETYHYLPAFLKTVPIPVRALIGDVDEQVRELQGSFDLEAWDRLDRRITQAYGLDEDARQLLIATHLTRVGALSPKG